MYCDFQVISYYKNLLRNTFINLQRSSSSNPTTTITTNLSEPHLPTSNIFLFPNPTTITEASWNHIYQFPTFFLSQTHRRKLQNSLRITFSNFQHCSKKRHKPNKDNYEGFLEQCLSIYNIVSLANATTRITKSLSEPHLPDSTIFPVPNPTTTITKACRNRIIPISNIFLLANILALANLTTTLHRYTKPCLKVTRNAAL